MTEPKKPTKDQLAFSVVSSLLVVMIRNDGAGSYTTPTEWKMWNQTKLSQSQLERLTAERLVAESKRLQDDVGNRVTSTRREVSSITYFLQLHLYYLNWLTVTWLFHKWLYSLYLQINFNHDLH